jgi:signal transduction histidine kinase
MKDVFSRRTLSVFSLIFACSGGLCFLQLRSLYLKDIILLQTTLEQRSSRLDERMRRSVVAVNSLQSEFTLQLNHQDSESSTKDAIKYQKHSLESSLKLVPDALRTYYVSSSYVSSKNSSSKNGAPKNDLMFFPPNRAEDRDSYLLSEPFFNLGTPSVNLMRSPYWTKSFPSDFGGMTISRAMPVYGSEAPGDGKADRFLGVVGMDILLENLLDTVEGKVYGDAQIFVVGHDRNLLLHPRFSQQPDREPIAAATALPPELQPHLEKILQGKGGEAQSIGGYRVIHTNLQNVPWNFVLWIPEHQLWLATIQSSFWSSIVPWVGLMTVLALITVEVRRREIAQRALHLQSNELSTALAQLKKTQSRMIQNEKMSSLSQLVGGIAHEINNPANFIHGNLKPAQDYVQSLLQLVELYEKQFPANHFPDRYIPIADLSDDIDLDFIKADLPLIMESMGNGTHRIREIVLLLRNFARMDEAALKTVDIHEGLESTIALMRHRFLSNNRRSEVTVKKLFANLPPLECYAGQLNQVFMALIGNAIDAINDCSGDHFKTNPPTLEISTTLLEDDRIQIQISDNGPGIPVSIQDRIFDPFFTTKAVGQGTGLGLAIAHQVITERHSGTLICTSQTAPHPSGTIFTLTLPLSQVTTFKANHQDQAPTPQSQTQMRYTQAAKVL